MLDLLVHNYTLLYQQDNATVFSFVVQNNLLSIMPNVSWRLETGEENITSASNVSLNGTEELVVLVEKQYTTFGVFSTIANASAGTSSQQSTLSLTMVELLVENLVKLNSNTTIGVFEFTIDDAFVSNRTATWSLDTNDTAETIWANNILNINATDTIDVIIEHNFTTTGNRTITAKANTTWNYNTTINTTI